jgi:hypothetical protein
LDFRHLKEIVKFFKYPDAVQLEVFDWINLTNFKMELIELQAISVWCKKLVELTECNEGMELHSCP